MNIRRRVGDHVIPVGWWTPELHRAVSEVPTRVWTESVLGERDTLAALRHFKPVETRVVILGQDPYPSPGKANGLAFGIRPEWVGDRAVSSSGNVAREASRGNLELSDVASERYTPEMPGIRRGFDFTLESWAAQGALLLNTDLSVAPGKPGSHRGVWREVVREIVRQLPPSVVWLAWGRKAVNFANRECHHTHQVLTATHPCRYSAMRATRTMNSYIGSNCFAEANYYLTGQGRAPVKWTQHRD